MLIRDGDKATGGVNEQVLVVPLPFIEVQKECPRICPTDAARLGVCDFSVLLFNNRAAFFHWRSQPDQMNVGQQIAIHGYLPQTGRCLHTLRHNQRD